MLKSRIIGLLVIKEGLVVQSIGFQKYLPVGCPTIAIEYLNRWGIDEIVVVDIDVAKGGIGADTSRIGNYSRNCHVPLTVGGGITSVDHIKKIIYSGADKVVINSALHTNPELITEGAKLFGNQCIVASIDARKIKSGQFRAYVNSGSIDTGYSPVTLAKKAEEYGAGEVLINSIDRDGAQNGYDLELIQQIINSVKIPVIACGGAGHPKHFYDVSKLDVSGIAAANYFHFTEQSVITTKSYLKAKAANVRLDSYATFEGVQFDKKGRVGKIDDNKLEKLRFEYIPEEVI